jgi:hypothetical protein
LADRDPDVALCDGRSGSRSPHAQGRRIRAAESGTGVAAAGIERRQALIGELSRQSRPAGLWVYVLSGSLSDDVGRARAGPQVQVVYVTVDPERDTAARMRAYLGGFDPTFVGGTGTPAQLASVRKDYGVMAERKPLGNSYSYAHSSSVYLIDRKGVLRGMMPYGQSPADYVHDIQILMGE